MPHETSRHSEAVPSATIATLEERAAVADLIFTVGERAARDALGLTHERFARIVAGLPVKRATLALARARLAASPVDEATQALRTTSIDDEGAATDNGGAQRSFGVCEESTGKSLRRPLEAMS